MGPGDSQGNQRVKGSRCTNGNVSCGGRGGGGGQGEGGGDHLPGDLDTGGRLIRFLMFLLQRRPDINIQPLN